MSAGGGAGWIAEVNKVNEAHGALAYGTEGPQSCRPGGLFFNHGGQTASKSCITSVTSEQQAIKGFTDSYEQICPPRAL